MNNFKYPLLNLKGKQYLQVAYRIQWLNDHCAENKIVFKIETEFINLTEEYSICKAKVRVGENYVEATKREDRSHFQDYIEKSETGAVGRALATLGFGTAFALADLEEGDRIVDAPLEKKVDLNLNKTSTKPSEVTDGKSKEEVKEIKKEFLIKKIGPEAAPKPSQPVEASGPVSLPLRRMKVLSELAKLSIHHSRVAKKYGVVNPYVDLDVFQLAELESICEKIKQGTVITKTTFPQTYGDNNK